MENKKVDIKYKYVAKPGETIDAKKEEYTNIIEKLQFAGLILLSYEILKDLIIKPIKFFYKDVTFSGSSPFVSYEHDVLSRDKYEFMACLLYLKDFMEAINEEDINIIIELMKKRNIVGHELSQIMENFNFKEFYNIALKTKDVLFKISNYRIRMELGADPDFQHLEWNKVVGDEYILFEKVLNSIKVTKNEIGCITTHMKQS